MFKVQFLTQPPPKFFEMFGFIYPNPMASIFLQLFCPLKRLEALADKHNVEIIAAIHHLFFHIRSLTNI